MSVDPGKHGPRGVVPGNARRRLNRWHWWWQAEMGWAGGAAMVMLVAALGLALVLPRWIEAQRSDLLRRQVKELSTQGTGFAAPPGVAGAATGARDPRDQWRSTLPPISARGRSIEQLLKVVSRHKVQMERVDYEEEDIEPGLMRLRVKLPVAGAYQPIRALLAGLLDALPQAGLDALELERVQTDQGSRDLRATLMLSLYFRRDAS